MLGTSVFNRSALNWLECSWHVLIWNGSTQRRVWTYWKSICDFVFFFIHRSQEEQQVQLAAHVPVHDGRHDHTAGVRRARPVGRQSPDHRQARVGPVRHRGPEEADRRRPRQQPRIRVARRSLPQESAGRADRRRVQYGVQLVHARVRGAHPEHDDQRDPCVSRLVTQAVEIIC